MTWKDEVLFKTEDITVNRPDVNAEGWTVVAEESIEYNKGEYILLQFNKDFPQFTVESYEDLCKVASRSKKLTEWLINANVSYSDSTQLPKYLEGLVDPTTYLDAQNSMQTVKAIIQKGASARQIAADNYKAEVKRIESKEAEELIKVKANNTLLKILTLNSQYLPLTLQLSIEGYKSTIGSATVEESRKVYGREILIQYKKALVEAWVDNREIDIDYIIESNQLK